MSHFTGGDACPDVSSGSGAIVVARGFLESVGVGVKNSVRRDLGVVNGLTLAVLNNSAQETALG